MNRKPWHYLRALLLLWAVCTSLFCLSARATSTDISNVPLGTATGTNVAPNLMFILDDSGSMASNFLPDDAGSNICKTCPFGTCAMTGATCEPGTPPFYAAQFNSIYYNPTITYSPGVNYLNNSLGNQTPTAAKTDPYLSASTINLVTGYTDIYWCTVGFPSAAQLADATVCRLNGKVYAGPATTNPFAYTLTSGLPDATFRNRVVSTAAGPHYYTITPREHCSDITLINCTLSATPTGAFTFPAFTRWCRTTNAVEAASAVSGNNISGTGARDCQANNDTTYQYARLGNFTRVDISTGSSYPRVSARTDCTGAVGATGCSGTEELQNFANWYSYYRTRALMMKTVPGRVFGSIGNDPNSGPLRAGFVTINASGTNNRYVKVDDFKTNTHRQAWFTKLYGIPTTTSGTPLREALSRVGRHFAGITSGINSFMPDDPMTASCQRNYALLTTDGYWNGNAGVDTGSSNVGDQDDTPSPSVPIYVDRATTGTLDGIGTVTSTVTPNTVLEQAICTGTGTATFSGPTSTACGCTGSQKRIVQRTRTFNTTLVQTDNAGGTPTNGTATDTYSFITGCTAPLVVTAVTPSTIVEQQVITGSNNSTFGAVNGVAAGANQAGVCTGSQLRIKQRTTTYNNTVVTTDGVAGAATISGTTYTFTDPGTCIPALVSTAVTPTTIVAEQVITATGSTTFPTVNGISAGANTAGVCPAGQKRVIRRTTTATSTVVTTNGTAAAAVLGASYAFTNVGACVAPLVVTAVTPVTVVEEQLVIASAATTFSAINGVTAGANSTGSCAAGFQRIKRRTTTYSSTVVTTDGTAAAPTVSGTAYSFLDVGGGCVSQITTTTTTPVTEVQSIVDNTTPTNFPNGVNNGSTAQTAFTSCTGGRTTRIQRTLSYNKVDTQVGAGPVTTAYTAGSAAFATLNACGFGTPAGTGPTVSFGSSSVATSGGPNPVPAATTTTNGATSTTSTGGPIPVAAATTTTTGATTTTTTGGPIPTAAATTSSTGAPTVTTTGGPTLVITLSPNPQTTTGASTTTVTTAGGTANTLADVAMYYYKNDLRTTGAFAKNNVPTSGTDIAPHQHMTTFTMGLGLDGQMTYQSDYDTATSGDFFKIKSGASNCLWTTGTCNWPAPAQNTATAIDDLWHAAVNGRGKYFSAKVPTAAESGIKQTLASINIATGSAAAAATSTPNLTTTNNSLFSTTYTTVDWDGEIRALSIDPSTGILNTTPIWRAGSQLNALGGAASDTRTIYTFSASTAITKLKSFTYTNLTASEQAYFDNKCTIANWSQCSYITLDATRLAAANTGANLVNYLRGQRGNELSTDTLTGYYRTRNNLLGDTVDAKPAFMGPPALEYSDLVTPDYGTFKAANASRTNTLFVPANDGMVHAFNADTGVEMWAYIPKMVMPNLFRLANASYGSNHTYYVDGSPTLNDVFIGGAWKTVLIGGLSAGGNGYYALDVTDPAAPKALWEICSNAALCGISDADMGLTFGPPVIGKRPTDGKWVAIVTSGYNNIATGNGGGYLYVLDMATGAVLEKIGTTISGVNVGTTTTPSGFARISGFVDNQISDNTVKLVYGGDLLGNMWRFDMSTSPITVKRIAQLKDGSTPARPQSITTRPEITKFNTGFNAIYVGTGRYLGTSDIPDASTLPTPPTPLFSYQQSVYAFKDTDADLGDLRLPAANLVRQNLTVIDAANRGISSNAVNWTTNNGWYVDLNPVCVTTGCSASGESPGERVNIDVNLVRGTLTVIANEPNADTCSAGGDSFLYQFDYNTGSFVAGTAGGVVGTKIGNTLSVGIVVFQTLTGQMKSVITASDGSLPQAPINTAGGASSARRAAWRELLDTRTTNDPTDIP